MGGLIPNLILPAMLLMLLVITIITAIVYKNKNIKEALDLLCTYPLIKEVKIIKKSFFNDNLTIELTIDTGTLIMNELIGGITIDNIKDDINFHLSDMTGNLTYNISFLIKEV